MAYATFWAVFLNSTLVWDKISRRCMQDPDSTSDDDTEARQSFFLQTAESHMTCENM